MGPIVGSIDGAVCTVGADSTMTGWSKRDLNRLVRRLGPFEIIRRRIKAGLLLPVGLRRETATERGTASFFCNLFRCDWVKNLNFIPPATGVLGKRSFILRLLFPACLGMG